LRVAIFYLVVSVLDTTLRRGVPGINDSKECSPIRCPSCPFYPKIRLTRSRNGKCPFYPKIRLTRSRNGKPIRFEFLRDEHLVPLLQSNDYSICSIQGIQNNCV
jgi:hypothetical protein